MNIQQLLNLLKVLPDGKTNLPFELVVDKLHSDIVVTIKLRLTIEEPESKVEKVWQTKQEK